MGCYSHNSGCFCNIYMSELSRSAGITLVYGSTYHRTTQPVVSGEVFFKCLLDERKCWMLPVVLQPLCIDVSQVNLWPAMNRLVSFSLRFICLQEVIEPLRPGDQSFASGRIKTIAFIWYKCLPLLFGCKL